MRTAAIVPLALSALALSACSGSDRQPCTPEHHTTCRDGVVYWVDACGSRGAAIEQCPCGCNAAASACQQPCPCIPDCADKQCGPDGCGNRCPPGCAADQTCTAEGRCRPGPSCNGVACQQPGEPNQGPDSDGDGWGDCCDCDDQDAAVNPGANEIIHNRKDDDCDPSTPDSDYPGDPDDRDDDGYLSQQAGGDDCDDLNADINPGAEERCNGLDDDCDGVIDGPDVCTTPDGGSDGGDEEPECTDISCLYDIEAACLQVADAYGVEVVQDGCSISFNLDAIYCTGTVDAAMNLYVSCAGLGFPCSGQASPTEPFTVTCSQDCSFVFEPLGSATACAYHDDPTCLPERQCSIHRRQADVITVCRLPEAGGGSPGMACTGSADCRNGLCLCGDGPCTGASEGVCSAICRQDADCIHSQRCGTIHIPDLSGSQHALSACVPDPDACVRHIDCDVGKHCIALLGPDGRFETECMYGPEGVINTGQPCQDSTDCFSAWCNQAENYCTGLCRSAAGCPTYEDSPSDCQSDAECTLEELCHDGGCKRAFECATRVLITGTDEYGQDIYQTLNMCRPIRRECQLPTDCRAGEACTIDNNETATAAGYACLPGHGPGELGDDCTQGGSDSCWSGLCVHAGDSGEAYCSQACTTATDCGPVEDCDNPDITCWDCQAIRVDIRPGYVSYLPTCIRL